MSDFRERLEQRAIESGAVLSSTVLDACAQHFELLVTWNRTHNLTRITEPDEAATRHYLDCLIPLAALPAPPSFVDVGSGAGFPGLMAALLWAGSEGVLIEPARKRASFLQQAAHAMGRTLRVESPGIGVTAPVVLSRATFSEGRRSALTPYASPRATVVVWGHSHDMKTWTSEVSTWPFWSPRLQEYRVSGVEPRSLLLAER